MEVSLSKALVEAEREIEVLRERSKRVAKLEQANIALYNEREEWKRRAEYTYQILVAHIGPSISDGDYYPELAKWFENEEG